MTDSAPDPLPAPALPEGYRLRRARFAELDARTFHDLARLRERVFVVEQECAYLELDGRDIETGTVHFWIEADGAEADGAEADDAEADDDRPAIAATLRLLHGRMDHGDAADGVQDPAGRDPEPRVIGRVVTAPEHRGRSLAAHLLRAAVAECDAAGGSDATGITITGASAASGAPVELHAQSHLTHWYARFGFAPCGPEFLEDGIPHTPMRRG